MAIPVTMKSGLYAGVLGKVIGVYLGSPIEGWSYERITRELGEIKYYVQEVIGRPLINPMTIYLVPLPLFGP